MARMKITRSPRIKFLAIKLTTAPISQYENLVRQLMDEVDKDLQEAFKLGQKFPEKEE